MSSVVKTTTPFLNRKFLLEALKAVGCEYTIQGDTIYTNRQDNFGTEQRFELINGRYNFIFDDISGQWRNIDYNDLKFFSSFIARVGIEYNAAYKRYYEELERIRLIAKAEEERKMAEEEKRRIEQERKEYIEKVRSSVIAKLEEEGFSTQEFVENNEKKLVFVRTTY